MVFEGTCGQPPNPGAMSAVAHVASLLAPDISVGEKIARSLAVFAFLAVALRLGGKREIGQITTLDLAILLLASNALQNALIGNDNSLTGGMLGAATLFFANYVFVRATLRSGRAQRVLEGTPTVLVRDGKVDAGALRHEAITEGELRQAAYEAGFEGLSEVPLVVLETNGRLNVMKRGVAQRWLRDRA